MESTKVQMTVSTAQFEQALRRYMDKQFNCQEECCRITAADNERCNPQPEPVKSAMTITQEQLRKVAKAVRESEWFGTGFEQAYAALTTLGISVEEEDV